MGRAEGSTRADRRRGRGHWRRASMAVIIEPRAMNQAELKERVLASIRRTPSPARPAARREARRVLLATPAALAALFFAVDGLHHAVGRPAWFVAASVAVWGCGRGRRAGGRVARGCLVPGGLAHVARDGGHRRARRAPRGLAGVRAGRPRARAPPPGAPRSELLRADPRGRGVPARRSLEGAPLERSAASRRERVGARASRAGCAPG